MRVELINYLTNNQYLRELFSDFINDFKEEYLYSNLKDKKELLRLKDEIFRNWLYSSIINETYITPYFLINCLAQENEKGEYVIIPKLLVNELVEKNKIDIEVKLEIYCENEHPIINDIDKIVKAASPSLILEYNDMYLLNENYGLMSDVSIQSEYYINYLIQLCEKLGVIKEIKAIKCKCFQKGDYYNEFINLSFEEKFNAIVNKTLDLSVKNINDLSNVQKLIEKEHFNKFLNNNIEESDFIDLVNELIPFANKFVDNIEDYTDDKNIIETIQFAQLLMGENVGSFVMGTEIRVYFDIYFTTIFSYYLGILAPVYMGTFLIQEIAIGLKESTTFFQKCANIFNDELEHNLTSFGEAIMSKRGVKLKKSTYDKIEKIDYSDILKKAKNEKTEVVARYEKCREIYGSDSNIIHKFMNIINENEKIEEDSYIDVHIEKFISYLTINEGLEENTVLNYSRYIEIFIKDFLECEKEENLKSINSVIIDNYLSDWFIRTVANSINSIKEQIRAIKHYCCFLYNQGIITENNMDNIKNTIKNKDKYILKYMKYLG